MYFLSLYFIGWQLLSSGEISKDVICKLHEIDLTDGQF